MKCHENILELFFFCPHCGDPLKERTDEKAFGAAQDYHGKKKQIVCKNCDLEHDVDFDYCPWCGLHHSEMPEEYKKKWKIEPVVEYGR